MSYTNEVTRTPMNETSQNIIHQPYSEQKTEEISKQNPLKLSNPFKKLNLKSALEWKKKYVEIMMENRPCEAIKEFENPKAMDQFLPAYIEVLEKKAGNEMSEVIRILKMISAKKPLYQSTEREIYFSAMVLSGFYNDKGIDNKASYKLFKKLQKMNPENGAYYFFNLPNITSKKEIADQIESMLRTRFFDAHMNWLFRQFWSASLDEYAFHNGSIMVFGNLPYPDYNRSLKILISYQNKLQDKTELSDYANMVANNNSRFRGQFIDLWWSPIEYSVFAKIFNKLNPTKPQFQHYSKVMNQDKNKDMRQKQSELWMQMKSNCTESAAEQYLENERTYFQDFKRQIGPDFPN
ncbi:MAG: hypothetical protein EP319_13560 [Deltaproteobacteria bacterium]|nr:MAG: hypothetical protein EP319_13560 [Deltaproteobacteria bacterium]